MNKMSKLSLIVVAFAAILAVALGFNPVGTRNVQLARTTRCLSMEYIPDGLSKKQWENIKKKEAEEMKKRQNGALGTTKFKSRSMEAWQKAGGVHLFPVNPNEVPYEERPYMQRKNGDWEGNDLKKIGLDGKGQGKASARSSLDNYYDDEGKKGKLNSISIFGGAPLPWTTKQTNSIGKETKKDFDPESAKKGVKTAATASGKRSAAEIAAMKSKLAKVSTKQTLKKANAAAAASTEEPPKKKGLFGLF
jgi:hypothetical protein